MNTNNIEQMTEQARSCLDNNQVNEAKDLYAEICRQDDANAEAWLMLGAINGETGKLEEAVSSVRKAIAIDPGYAEAHLTLAQLLHAQGDLEGALAAAQAATASDPDYHEAFQFLGAMHGQAGNYQEAEAASRKLTEMMPENADAYVNLGNALGIQGKLDAAETSYQKALQLNAALASAYSGLGNVYIAQQHFEKAESALNRAIELEPGLIEAHNNLGILHMSRQNFDSALDCFNRAITITPDYAPAHANTGNIYLQKGEFQKAVAKFKEAIEYSPRFSEAYLALANTYRAMDNRDDARTNYALALEFKPGYLPAHYNLGILEEETGNLDKALDCYGEVLRLTPDDTDAQAARASVFEKKGDIGTAYGIIRPLLDRGIQSAKLGTVYATLCAHYDNCQDASQYLEKLVSMPALTDNQRADIHFSLGTLADRLEQYDNAFTHFSQANDSIRAIYSPDEFARHIDSVIESNSASILGAIPLPATTSNRPIFIVGMPRSGSTLVEQIISAHPQVHGGGELGGIFRITEKLQSVTGSDKPYPACLTDVTQAVANTITSEYLESLQQVNATAMHVTDKMLHNFQHLGLIHALFPQAPLIQVKRNPLDTCLSCYFHHFGGYHPYTHKLEHLASHYRQYQRLMRHWKQALGLPILEIEYEELVANPEAITRRLIEYCGLEWDESCLEYHKSGRLAKTASYAQVREPIYSRAIGRWKHYKRHIKPLLEEFPGAAEA